MLRSSLPGGIAAVRQLTRRRRTGRMDTTTVVILVVAGIGGLAFLGCAGMLLMVVPSIHRARTAARVMQSGKNLEQIGLAMHNYHEIVASFPPGGVYAADGTPHHSWQTMLLPYLGQAAMYNQIDFNKPWTDPLNQFVFRTPVPVFLHPEQLRTTSDEGFGLSHYAGNKHVFLDNSTLRIPDITDGTSHTMAAGEVAGSFKGWGDPSNVRDPADGVHGDTARTFGASVATQRTFQVLMTDGSLRDVSTAIDPAVMKAIATPAGGEPPPSF